MSHYEQKLEVAAKLAARRGGLNQAAKYLSRYGYTTFGIEGVTTCGAAFSYLNTGDTYNATIVHIDGEYRVSTWGDEVERIEHEYDEENGTVACGYCSHHTPIENDDWRTTTCEQCGHCVSG